MPVYQYQNIEVHYRNTGSGKPLLILHGWGSQSSVMMPLAEKLSANFSCYIPDLPGFGSSGLPPSAWSVDDYADFTLRFMNDIGIDKTDVLAHSFGGRIMLKLCARPDSADRFGKILITGGAGMRPRRKLSFYLKKYTAKLLKAPLVLLPGMLREKTLSRLRSTPLWKRLGSSEYQSLQGVMRETFVKTVTEFLEPCLPAIDHEILLLWGQDDEATPVDQARRMEKGLAKAALVILEDAGHYAFLDKPDHFRSIAEAFFIPRPARSTP